MWKTTKKVLRRRIPKILGEEIDTLSQKNMAEMLNVAEQIIFDRLDAMGKILKSGK